MPKYRLMSARIGLLFFLAVGISGCSPTPVVDVDVATAEVEAREIAFARSMAERDIEAFQRFLSPEAVFFKGNEPLRGPKAIVEAWAPFFEGEAAPFSWHPDVVEVLESGRLALSSGPVTAASGELVGRFNSIWRKDGDGQWLVVFDKGS